MSLMKPCAGRHKQISDSNFPMPPKPRHRACRGHFTGRLGRSCLWTYELGASR